VLKNDRLLTALKNIAQVQEFDLLTGKNLTNWIITEFAALGIRISEEVAVVLAQRQGNDLWNLANEIQKLGHFVGPKEIKLEDIERSEVITKETNILQRLTQLHNVNKKQAFYLINEHITKGDHPLYLLTMIANQFRNLLLVKSCGEKNLPINQLGIHPYVLSKTINQARRFSYEEIKKIYGLICQTDLNIKIT